MAAKKVYSGCVNASPAGKRRIAAAAEQQQFGSSYGNNGGIYGNLIDDTGGSKTGRNTFLSRFGSPLTTITAIAVAACLLIIAVFAIVFAVLQRSSHYPAYNKVPTNGSRKQRVTSSSTLLQIEGEINNYEEEDDEEEIKYKLQVPPHKQKNDSVLGEENYKEEEDLALHKLQGNSRALIQSSQNDETVKIEAFAMVPFKKPKRQSKPDSQRT